MFICSMPSFSDFSVIPFFVCVLHALVLFADDSLLQHYFFLIVFHKADPYFVFAYQPTQWCLAQSAVVTE